ncbi:hypothetical protein IEQ34_011678 [Dendrobium chrysotoxum]|uniref:Uncharacterized protein n=1 Tax=Dendrobium chrysotoxum TaxID=161865 RepID=A0AAV7GAM7_DENCH|nr:hypothetical protein IEQ34_011678 [Dendrobium chrysotoxum]
MLNTLDDLQNILTPCYVRKKVASKLKGAYGKIHLNGMSNASLPKLLQIPNYYSSSTFICMCSCDESVKLLPIMYKAYFCRYFLMNTYRFTIRSKVIKTKPDTVEP